jgi:HK97 family phage portal protein
MSLWSRMAALLAPRRKMTIEEWFEAFGDANRSATGDVITQLSALRVSTVWACVTILAEDVAKLPWHVYRKAATGEKTIAAEHPLERLLQRPNNWQTGFEFKEQMMAALLMRRNAYAPIIRDGRGRPTALIPVNPDWSTLFEAPDGSLFYEVARSGQHLAAMLRSLPQKIPADDMLHIRGMSLNGLWGQSAISSGRDAIGLALAQQEMAAIYASNGTQLSGVLQTDKSLSDQAYARLEKSWKEKRAGKANAGETAILEEGLKFSKLALTSVDAEFDAARRRQVEEIARLFRVPPHKLGIIESRTAGSSLVQQDQDYVNNVVSSWAERIEAKMNETFGLDEAGVFVEFDFSRFLRADILTRYQAYRLATGGAAWLTPNEVRRPEGVADDPDGNVLLRPAALVPLGTPVGAAAGAALGSDATGSPAPGGDGDPVGPQSPDDSAPSG